MDLNNIIDSEILYRMVKRSDPVLASDRNSHSESL